MWCRSLQTGQIALFFFLLLLLLLLLSSYLHTPSLQTYRPSKTSSDRRVGATGRVSCAAVNDDGSRLLTAADDGMVKLWNVGTGQCLKYFLLVDDPFSTVSAMPEPVGVGFVIDKSSREATGGLIVCVTRQGHILMYKNGPGGVHWPFRQWTSHRGESAAEGGRGSGSGSPSSRRHASPLGGGKPLSEAKSDGPEAVALCLCSSELAVSWEDGSIRVWTTDAGDLRFKLNGSALPDDEGVVSWGVEVDEDEPSIQALTGEWVGGWV
jgi:WD40 repeat protein